MNKQHLPPDQLHLFDTEINRYGSYSVKWERDIPSDTIPLWVADTDFISPEPVIHALQNAVQHGVFGYSFFADEVKKSVIHWLKKRHHYEIQKDWLLFHSGVVPSIATIIQALTKEKDQILVQPPVYPPFMNLVNLNNRTLVQNELIIENGLYTIDFQDFERKLQNGVKLFILCSPHNPVGRVWTTDELKKMVALCNQYNVIILSDEIHHDLTLFGHKHTPTATFDPLNKTITLFAPSKTFNVAGLKASVIVCENKELREKIAHQQLMQGTTEVNKMGIVALKACYDYGEPWLEEQLTYLEKNILFTKSFIEDKLPNVTFIQPEGTYLLWLDFSYYTSKVGNIKEYLAKKGKVIVEDGHKFGLGGDSYIRLNVGTQRSRLEEGLNRIYHCLQL